MSAHPGDGKVRLQAAYQCPHGVLLPLGPGIGRSPLCVKTTFVGYADAVAVESPCMGTSLVQHTGGVDVAVLADVEVITDALHPLPAVATEQVLLRKVPVCAGGGAMHHYQRNAALHATQAVIPSAPAMPDATAMIIFNTSFHTLCVLSLLFIIDCVC